MKAGLEGREGLLGAVLGFFYLVPSRGNLAAFGSLSRRLLDDVKNLLGGKGTPGSLFQFIVITAEW